MRPERTDSSRWRCHRTDETFSEVHLAGRGEYVDDGEEARAAVGRPEEKTRSSDRKGGGVGPKSGTFNQLPTRLKQRERDSKELGGTVDEEEGRAQERGVRRGLRRRVGNGCLRRSDARPLAGTEARTLQRQYTSFRRATKHDEGVGLKMYLVIQRG